MKMEVGTLKEIGAQVGDVVEEGGGGITCKVLENECLFTTHDDGISQILERGWYWDHGVWRIVSRASDSIVDESKREDIAKDYGFGRGKFTPVESPIRTRTVTEIVPGVYGDVRVHDPGSKYVRINIDAAMDCSSIRAAIATLTQIADAMEAM